jgi:hypothetical protein
MHWYRGNNNRHDGIGQQAPNSEHASLPTLPVLIGLSVDYILSSNWYQNICPCFTGRNGQSEQGLAQPTAQ